MPRFPNVAPSIAGLSSSLYTKLAERLASYEGEVYPLHVGDTWMEPAVGTRMEDLSVLEYPGMHRYAPVQGRRELVEAIVEKTREQTGTPTEPASVLVTAGATGALGAAIGAVVEPGDEVLILAPFWPLTPGIVASFRARPVPVPFFGAVESAEAAVSAVRELLTNRTVALYLNSPNNPTGRVLPVEWIEALVEWALSESLWILADEVYEDYVFDGDHVYTRPLAPDSTVSFHSFSKAYGMAGNRCGYAVGPETLMSEMRKISTHTFYSAPTAAQIAATRALKGMGSEWIENARTQYRDIGRRTAQRLGVEPPQGSTFLFLDLADKVGETGLAGFLERCVDKGLLMTPGPSFGPYPHHVRICFTAMPPASTLRGVEVLADLLGIRQ